MKISLRHTRKVLFEKFNIKHEMRDFLLSRIEGCEIKYLKKYPDSTFFVKNDKFMLEQDFKNGHLLVRYDGIWSVFESKYQLSYKQIQVFITDTLENQLKIEGLTPPVRSRCAYKVLENQLKIEGLTPPFFPIPSRRSVGRTVKNGGINTTARLKAISPIVGRTVKNGGINTLDGKNR